MTVVTLGFLTSLWFAPAVGIPARITAIDPRSAPTVEFVHLRTQQHHRMTLFDADGHMKLSELSRLREFLSDPRTKIDHPIHWRLATLLVAIAAQFPGLTLEVVSGYRHQNRHHKRSRHLRGRAIDFRVEGVENRALFDLLRRSLGDVGLGYYPNSTFIHLDVRDTSSFWVDYSGPGQTPCYSRTPAEDLASGVAESTTYAQAMARGCKKPGKTRS